MQVIKLNIIPDGIYPRVYVNQYDIGRQFQILFYEDISRYYMPNGVTFKINGRKADNHVFEYTESDKYDDSHYVITKSGSGTSFQIVISTTEQMTAAAGDAEVQLTLKDSTNRVIGTLNFILAVQERPASVGDPSESDLPDIVRSVNGIGPDADGDVGLKWSDMSSVSNLAITEETRIMTAQRVAGSYVFVKADDQLYEVTTTINASGTLTPGTNATARSVGYVLEQLNSDIASQALTFTWDENTHSAGSVVTARKAGNVVTLRFWNVSFSNVISTDMQVGHITGYTATHDHSFMFASGDQVPLMGTGYISNAGKVYVSHYQTANKLVYGTATLVL